MNEWMNECFRLLRNVLLAVPGLLQRREARGEWHPLLSARVSTGVFMKKVPISTRALRDRQIVSIEQVS